MAEATSKRESDGGDMDRISGLPDSVLLHILSFLPTKTCVSTMSLVSRRWRHLWEQLQVFDFSGDYDEDDDIKQVKKFAFFVNAVLTICRSGDILKMRLNCGLWKQGEFSMIYFVNLWVRAAIGPRLEELHLMLPRMKAGCSCVFSESLFNCSNLVSLSLKGAIHLKVQHSWALVHFPSLKNLYLDILSVDSIDDLLTGCPILETLYIIDADDVFRFRVPPSVKSLKYKDYSESTSTYIDINAPHLECLSITTKGTFETDIGNLHNVVEAYIDVSFPDDGESVNHLLNLLGAISGTKHLTLCSSTTKLLQCAPIPDFPVFRCLLNLSLQLPCFNSKLLAKVLENCLVLQDLVICSDEKVMPLQLWEPESTRIHNCLVSHLTSIHIKGYGGFEDELSFVEYILRNALVLKTIIIKPHSSMVLEEKFNILKKLINIPRGCSDLCQFEFD